EAIWKTVEEEINKILSEIISGRESSDEENETLKNKSNEVEISIKIQDEIAGEMKKEASDQEKVSQNKQNDTNVANTAKSIFVLLAIVNSESLLILDTTTKNIIIDEKHKR
ncbi:2560_t:CDS:2, partial [Dentiscutata heterogama]